MTTGNILNAVAAILWVVGAVAALAFLVIVLVRAALGTL